MIFYLHNEIVVIFTTFSILGLIYSFFANPISLQTISEGSNLFALG